ncbi:FecR family protein [Pedobacter westerhofensis]|uniref:FecR family protein n=1 Tax=Pedobacter westerhofensis TaxID=425512 RepID=A0A521EGG3_9SPHI|nr:FecR domain-containing protein [Pedobacter westerhofensis]SMO82250.1 FecR family protein [Pedobacter westerhofensis]
MTTEEIKQILERYNTGQCTELEKTIIEETLMQFNEDQPGLSEKKLEKLGNEIYRNLPGSDGKSRRIKLLSIITAVASVSLIGIITLLFYPRPNTSSIENKSTFNITPGGNKATLTLANGKTINLSAAKTGIIIDDNNIKYIDSTAITNRSGNAPGMATISTPKGGEYQIVLSDGTKVWLNAATTLQFSANLMRERGERKVRLERGEAYFEVYKDKKRPFVVETGQQDVLVLGTHFNIDTYEPGSIKTTLLEGSVRVQSNVHTSKTKSKILVPGEQSVNKAGAIEVRKVNTNIELAWKKGKIQFVRADLKTVMGMISRWYDIQVVYQYYPVEGKFTGSISRSKNISEVLNLLETTGDVRFKIKERQVLVMK